MQTMSALATTQHKSVICNFWPQLPNFRRVSWPL